MFTKVTLFLVLAIVDISFGHRHTKAAKYQQQRISNHMPVSNGEDFRNTESESALLQYQAQNTEGYYKFGYANPDGQYRVEEGSPDEGILGSYGYESEDGNDIKVYYRAGVHGFQIITADLYKTLLSERTKTLEIDLPEDLTPTFEIEPYAEQVKPKIKSPEKPAPFSFVASRNRGSTTPKPTTTTTTTTTTSRPEPETVSEHHEQDTPRHPHFNQLPDINMGQSSFPTNPFAYPPPYGNMPPPWRFSNSLVPPLYNVNGAVPPIPVYYSPQFGIQPLPVPSQQMLPRFAPNMQLPLIIKV